MLSRTSSVQSEYELDSGESEEEYDTAAKAAAEEARQRAEAEEEARRIAEAMEVARLKAEEEENLCPTTLLNLAIAS